MLMQVRSGFAMGGKRALGTIGFHDSAMAAASSVSMPAGIAAGDLAVLFDFALDTSVPTDATPSGFTAIGTSQTSLNGGIGIRWNQSYKVLTGGETTVTGMSAFLVAKNLLVFRVTGAGSWGAPASIGQEVGQYGGTMASDKTVTVGVAPLVVLGCIFGGASGDLDMSPAATAEQNLDADSQGWLNSGYIIYNSAPSDNTVGSTDDAADLAVAAFYIPLV